MNKMYKGIIFEKSEAENEEFGKAYKKLKTK